MQTKNKSISQNISANTSGTMVGDPIPEKMSPEN